MSKRTVLAWFGCFLFPAVVGTRSADAQCIDWKSGFGPPVIGTDARVSAEIVFDDGSGPALYLGGAFQSAGGSTTSSTVRWRGSSWSSLGFGFGTVRAFAVSGASGSSSLYRAGLYSSVDRWTGTSWSPLPGQLHGSPGQGYALASFDDGSGPALYVGGSFDSINAVPMNGIARWNGSTWSPLGSGLGESYAEVQALAVFDDGTGPALYAAGYFDSVGGVSAANIAKWNGSSWSALGGGLDAVATSLGVFDDGSGAALYAGGSFTNAGGQSAAHIAKWNGSSWSSLAGGTDGSVDSLQVWNDGGGTALFAGGKFTNAGGQPSNHFARWNGSSWQPVGNGVAGNASSDVYGLAVFDDGSGAALYAGGEFTTAGSAQANNIARWNASNWSSLGPAGPGMNGQVNALKSYDDGSGSALYAGGTFTDAGGALVTALAKWNGSSWSHVGTGLTALQVTALEVADVGSGPELYVGGAFMSPGHRLVRWNGSSWSAVGGDVNNVVWALTAFPASSGSVLYAGGNFTMAGSTAVSYVARFDGANWTALGSGLDNSVYALAVFDDGSGPALYAGGNFTNAGGSAASAIAKWDGTSWSALGA